MNYQSSSRQKKDVFVYANKCLGLINECDMDHRMAQDSKVGQELNETTKEHAAIRAPEGTSSTASRKLRVNENVEKKTTLTQTNSQRKQKLAKSNAEIIHQFLKAAYP